MLVTRNELNHYLVCFLFSLLETTFFNWRNYHSFPTSILHLLLPRAGKSTFDFLVQRCWELGPCLRKELAYNKEEESQRLEKRRDETQSLLQVFQEYSIPGTGSIPRLLPVVRASGIVQQVPSGKLQVDFCPWSSRVPINTSNVSKTIYGKETDFYYFLNFCVCVCV